MPDDDLRRCVRSVLALGQDLDATSIAEVLWLASAASATATAVGFPVTEVTRLGALQEEARRAARPQPSTPQQATRPEKGKAVAAQALRTTSGATALAPTRRVKVQRAKALSAPLDLARSLRSFKRPWPDGRRLQLDIDATIRAYARTWQLIPEFRPAPERWFELSMVIDDSQSMTVWNDVISELSTLLLQLGAFRSIRTWRMSLAGTIPLIRNEGGQPSGSDQLRAPDGRRLIIVVTDGAAPGWFHPEVWQMIRAWAASTPTALISPLATRLWRRTGLNLPAVRATSVVPGSPNAALHYSVPYLLRAHGDCDEWLPVPAAALTSHMLGRWAKTIMRGDPRGCDVLLIPSTGRPNEDEDDIDAEPPSGRELVEAFRRLASPEAARLAVLSALFTAISLPLLHLIRQELVPAASTGDLAEVIVGGLFRPPRSAPDGVVLHFRDDVRAHLQQLLAESDAWRMYEVLKRHITQRTGSAATFTAAFYDPLGNIGLPADLQPFVAASRDALEFLGALPGTTSVTPDRGPAAPSTAPTPGRGPSAPSVVPTREPLDLSVARYLRPEEAIVPFRARPELDELLAWCASGAHTAVRLVIGDAGAGKTRLALRLGEELVASGWQPLWVQRGSERDAVGAVRTMGQPCVLVADYAEARSELVGLLADVAAEQHGPDIRVVLLARSAGEWWQYLLSNAEERTMALLEANVPLMLGPVRAAGGPQELFDGAVAAFAQRMGTGRPDARLVLSDPDPVILAVHVAALLAVVDYSTGARTQDQAVSVLEVLDALLRHEARYWVGSAASRGLDLDVSVLRLVVAVGCLIGADSETAAVTLLARVPDLESAELRGRVARWLHDLYPASDENDTQQREWFGLLRPDQLITSELAKRPELIAPLFTGLDEARATRTLTVLARAALTHDHALSLLRNALAADLDHLTVPALLVAVEINPMVGELLSQVIGSQPVSHETLMRVAAASPYPQGS